MHILLERNEKSWITEAGGPKLKKKQENKNIKLELARRQKEEKNFDKNKADKN